MSGRRIPVRRAARHLAIGLFAALLLLASPGSAHASLLPPELEDKLANFLALFVIFVVPCVLIVLFWLVHILPERIAHKRHHPQFEAIRTLCLLSLVFGGLLWPIAWIWAYSKPVFYKMAFGTDAVKHGPSGHEPPAADTTSLRERIARLEGRVPETELDALRAELTAIEMKYATPEVP